MNYESEELPTLEDGRPYITAEMAIEHPELMAFIRRFPDFWVQESVNQDIWVGSRREALKREQG